MNSNLRTTIANFSLFFIKKYRITLLLFISIVVIGFSTYSTFLKREGFPAVDIPIAVVNMPYFVNDTGRVDREVTEPVEKILLGLDQVKKITSNTTNNFASFTVEFPDDMTSGDGNKLIQDEITRSGSDFVNNLEINFVTVDAGKFMGLYDFVLTLSADKSIPDLTAKSNAVATELDELDLVQSAETIELITKQIDPATSQEFDYQQAFNRVGMKTTEGDLVFRPAISIGITRDAGVDSIKLSNQIRDRIDELQDTRRTRDNQDDVDLEGFEVVYTADMAIDIQDQIDSLQQNAVSGLIAVAIVVFIFVGWRAAVLAAIFIPTVMAATFIALFIGGYSLNVISLFSLILVLGLFVDDAIVVIEAIDYKLRQGLHGLDAVREAIKNISIADLAGTITTALVFVPLLFTTGILGDFIRLIPITVILALTLSLLLALSVTAFLANIFLTKYRRMPGEPGPTNQFVNLSDVVMVRYDVGDIVLRGPRRLIAYLGLEISSFIGWYLDKTSRMVVIMILSLALVGFGIAFAGRIPFSVFPAPKDAEALMVALTFPEGSNEVKIQDAEAIAKSAETILTNTAEAEIETVDYIVANRQTAWLQIKLTPVSDRDRTSGQIIDDLDKEFEDFGQIRVKVDALSAGPPASEFPFAVQVKTNDDTKLKNATAEINTFLTDREIESTQDSTKIEVTEVVVENIDSIAKINGERFAQVKAKISEATNTGAIIELQELVEEEFDEDHLEKLGLEQDALGFDFGQESENIESFQSTIFALIISLIVMYALLVLQFDSFTQPLLIYLAIPLSFPGLFPGLFLTGNSMSFFVALGITGLVGIVVNNTIMLVDYTNQARDKARKGEDGRLKIKNAIVKATQVRFRPIVATSVTTVAGLLPLALSDPFWEALALTIIFGLISSMILVLLTFPVYYTLIERLRRAGRTLVGSGPKPTTDGPEPSANG